MYRDDCLSGRAGVGSRPTNNGVCQLATHILWKDGDILEPRREEGSKEKDFWYADRREGNADSSMVHRVRIDHLLPEEVVGLGKEDYVSEAFDWQVLYMHSSYE